MYNGHKTYPYSYCVNPPMYNLDNGGNYHNFFNCPYYTTMPMYNPAFPMLFPNQWGHVQVEAGEPIRIKDYGPEPFVVNIEKAAEQNNTFRTALWTGKHLQLTLMSINVGEDIGLEMHPDVDQFIRIEEGQGLVKMGNSKDKLDFQANVREDYIIIIPAGKWHNLINTGNKPIKLYSIYAPPEHPHGTVHVTKPR